MSILKNANGAIIFPPYGTMSEGMQQTLDKGPDVPAAFRPDQSDAARTEQWITWRDATKKLITDTLWPEWNAEMQEWYGASVANMEAITRADLDIVLALKANVLRCRQPASPLGDPARPNHIAFFRVEDDGVLFSQYQFYDSTISAQSIDHFRETFDNIAGDKFGTVHLQFKRILQRPRPFQTVFLTGHIPFNPLRSISAYSPSMCSGHCFQGVTGIGAVIERILNETTPLSRGSLCALRQLAVDIGDRRVFAGVHYPSDNLASWLIAMRLADEVFSNSDVKAHLWRAISRQSRVFQEVARVQVYKPALDLLRAAAANVESAAAALPGC